jgi:hypothetical protein
VDDDLRLGVHHRVPDALGVERVGHDRLSAECTHRIAVLPPAGHADDVVAASHELGDELGADGAGGSRHEDLHERSCGSVPGMRRTLAPDRARRTGDLAGDRVVHRTPIFQRT